MKKVTKEEYWNSFKDLDAVHTVNDTKGYPYISEWRLRGKIEIIAKSVPTDKLDINREYFIKAN